ncbi:MAG: glycosyltransferase [Bacteroidales bacterium]|nr:glycosyltransferase [Bacteroidales bacterium]
MHILEIPSFFGPHGGDFCLEQSRALQSVGHEVRILSCTQLALSIDRAFYFNAPRGCWREEIEGIECSLSYVHGVPKCVQFNEERWVNRVLSMYRDYRERYGCPDVIHAHCTKWAGVAARQIGLQEGIPYFITEHLSSILFKKDFGANWEKHRWAQKLLQETMEEAACVIPVSEELVQDLSPYFGQGYRHHAISNIVDTPFFGQGKSAAEIAETRKRQHTMKPFRYVCLARADVYGKGLDVLAETVKQKWFQEGNYELHIAGRGTEKLRSMFPQLNVILHGNLKKEEVRDLLWQCQALVLPSRGESQALVVFEAICSGIPVVISEAIPRSVRQAEASVVVPTGDAEALARGMQQVVDIEPDAAWIEKARSVVSPQSVAAQLEQLFTQR